MFMFCLLSSPHSHIHVNYLPWFLAQCQDVIFPIYNYSDKATIYLKSLQTEMMEILKVSFALLPMFSKSIDHLLCAVSEPAELSFLHPLFCTSNDRGINCYI